MKLTMLLGILACMLAGNICGLYIFQHLARIPTKKGIWLNMVLMLLLLGLGVYLLYQ